jgi:hypothetical protein
MNNPILALDAVTAKWEVPSYSLVTDAQQQVAASRRLLRAGQRQRWATTALSSCPLPTGFRHVPE